jgi:hypothetical protein
MCRVIFCCFWQLFRKTQVNLESALYPGSFVHITPSFVFLKTTYVDTDMRTKQIFQFPEVFNFIEEHKVFPQRADVSFHALDYQNALDMQEESYDLLISQYAGFVSQHCKRYLRISCYLLVNNSHGDASVAYIDWDNEFFAAVLRSKGKHRIREKNLDTYFIPKKPVDLTKEYLEHTKKGIGYQKTAS